MFDPGARAGLRAIVTASLILAAFATLNTPQEARAEEVLTIGSTADQASTIKLTLADLDALRQVQIATTTPWTQGIQQFSGPPLREVLAKAGLTASSFKLVALNDYSAQITAENIGTDYPIVATRLDGDTISIRTNGPFWIIYPYDMAPEFQTEVIFSLSVWQLASIQAEQT